MRSLLKAVTGVPKTHLWKALAALQREESGQGLVEYVLLIALVAFAATAGMSQLASAVNSAFNQVGTILAKYVS